MRGVPQKIARCGSRSLQAVLASALLLLSGDSLLAQSRTIQTPTVVTVGDPCRARADPRPGVIKVDACGRWYCGRPEVKDIVELRPNIAEERGCEWQVVGERCRCLRIDSPGRDKSAR